MVLICPHCQVAHTIDRNKIPDGISKVRCKECKKEFPLDLDSGENLEKKSPRKIAIALSKGGVGKTTTAVNLSGGLALAGYKVLLVDTDTQGQATFMLGVKPQAGLTEFINDELSFEECVCKARDNLWLLAGGKSIAGLKRVIERKEFGGEITLSENLSRIENDFDFIILDTSPGWDQIVVNVLFYAQEVLATVSLEVMTLQSLVEFSKNISSIQKYNKDLSLRYILPTQFDKRVKNSQGILDKLEELYGSNVCTPIRYNVRVPEAPSKGQTIYEFAPGSKGAHDYRDLIRKVTGNEQLFT